MRKILFILLPAIIFPSVYAAYFSFDGNAFALEDNTFSFSLDEGLLYFRGKYFSYGRLDSLSSYSTLFNPYRKYHYTNLNVAKSRTRGLRGFLFRYKGISFAFSTEEALSAAFSYSSPYLDFSVSYYDRIREWERSVIYNYRRDEMRDVYSMIVRGKYRSFLDLMGILSYSPLLGIDGFYRLKARVSGISITLSYGNTFLSGNDDLFSAAFSIRSTYLDYDYYTKYSEASLYTDYFRVYESYHVTTLKLNGARLKFHRQFSFYREAEL